MRTLKTLLCLSLICLFHQLVAQNYVMDGSPITACEGQFFDPGGDEDYEPEEDFGTLICSNQSAGHILLQFQEIDLLIGDELAFYDGQDESAPLITPVIDIYSGSPFAVQATAVNSSGCLYVTFRSDEDGEASGWRATISCMVACQPILTEITSDPAVSVNNGFVDICLGDSVSFTSQTIFPQNGTVYQQSLATSTLEWQVGNHYYPGTSSLTNIFDSPGIYAVNFTVTDAVGCPTINPGSLSVRVSQGPTVTAEGLQDNTYCFGETFVFYTAANEPAPAPGYTLLPDTLASYNGNQSTDTLMLPDGLGGMYISTIILDQYPAGATVSPSLPFDSLWMFLEHSYSGDLDIEIICPNGQSIFLLEFPTPLGSTNFGEPFASHAVDGQSVDLTPGIPYRYAFTLDAANGTLIEFKPNAPVYEYTTVHSDLTTLTYTYQDTYFPAGQYRPSDPFTELEGCPFNGEWTLQVTDNLGLDNGYVFGWGIGEEHPNNTDGYAVSPVDWYWESEAATLTQNLDSVIVEPTETGLVDLYFNVVDDFGCTTTTIHTVNVLPPNHPECDELNIEPTAPVGRNNVLPMPFTNEVYFRTAVECADCQLTIFNIHGQKMGTYPLQQQFRINTQQWPAGFYFYQTRDAEGRLIAQEQMVKVD